MRLWAWGQSDPGRKRERNEDSYLVDPSLGVMAVADGMGGHQGGATASRMAVELLARELAEARGDFDAALREADSEIARARRPRRCRRGRRRLGDARADAIADAADERRCRRCRRRGDACSRRRSS